MKSNDFEVVHIGILKGEEMNKQWIPTIVVIVVGSFIVSTLAYAIQPSMILPGVLTVVITGLVVHFLFSKYG